MARAALNWSQGRLAEAAGVAERDVQRVEQGLHVDADEARRIRLALEGEGMLFLADEGMGPGVRVRGAHAGNGIRPDELSAANDG